MVRPLSGGRGREEEGEGVSGEGGASKVEERVGGGEVQVVVGSRLGDRGSI